jgi:hypothetical protein
MTHVNFLLFLFTCYKLDHRDTVTVYPAAAKIPLLRWRWVDWMKGYLRQMHSRALRAWIYFSGDLFL